MTLGPRWTPTSSFSSCSYVALCVALVVSVSSRRRAASPDVATQLDRHQHSCTSEMVFKFDCIMLDETRIGILYFACRRKDVHLCFITSPGKMIFAVLEL